MNYQIKFQESDEKKILSRAIEMKMVLMMHGIPSANPVGIAALRYLAHLGMEALNLSHEDKVRLLDEMRAGRTSTQSEQIIEDGIRTVRFIMADMEAGN